MIERRCGLRALMAALLVFLALPGPGWAQSGKSPRPPAPMAPDDQAAGRVEPAPPSLLSFRPESWDERGSTWTPASTRSPGWPATPQPASIRERVSTWIPPQESSGDMTRSILLGAALGTVALGAVGWIVESNSENCENGTCVIIGAAMGLVFGGVTGYLVGRGGGP